MTETWKPVGPFAPNYSASSLGRVRNDATGCIYRPCTLRRASSSRQPYLGVNIFSRNHGGRRGIVSVHRLVCMAFHGMPASGQITRHINGDSSDNRPENLAWGTYLENEQDKLRHGTTAHGEQLHHGHLTAKDISAIREERAAGAGIQALGKKHGVAWSHVSAICTGKWWTRAGGPITRGVRTHRTIYARGEQRSDAKMSDGLVRSLKADRVAGMTYSELSLKYGICGSLACRIVHGRAWSHV